MQHYSGQCTYKYIKIKFDVNRAYIIINYNQNMDEKSIQHSCMKKLTMHFIELAKDVEVLSTICIQNKGVLYSDIENMH